MTVSISFSTVADSIAGLSITGVTIADINQIGESNQKTPKHLCPRPQGYITNIVMDEPTFGAGATRKLTLRYTLTYRYYHAEIVGGRGGLFAVYSGMITNITRICNAILTNDTITGCVDIALLTIGELGPVSDPAGNAFHGCDLSFRITEYIN